MAWKMIGNNTITGELTGTFEGYDRYKSGAAILLVEAEVNVVT
jgi:hypothetical protein